MSRGTRFDAKQIVCTVVGGVFVIGLVLLVALHLGKKSWSAPSITPSAEAQPDFKSAKAESSEAIQYDFFAMLDAPAPQRPLPELGLPMNPALDPVYRQKLREEEAAKAKAAQHDAIPLDTGTNSRVKADKPTTSTDSKTAKADKAKTSTDSKTDKVDKAKTKTDKAKASDTKTAASADSKAARAETATASAAKSTERSQAVDELVLAAAVAKPSDDAKPAKEAPKSSKFTVQVSAFQDEAVARNLAQSLEGQGYEAHIKAEEIPGRGTWYRVRVGRFASRDEADAAKKQLARKAGYEGFVTAP